MFLQRLDLRNVWVLVAKFTVKFLDTITHDYKFHDPLTQEANIPRVV